MTGAERQARSRATQTNYEPFLFQMDRHGLEWIVKMKAGAGHFVWLTEKPLPKRMAAREMRRIRQQMAETWLAAQSANLPTDD